MSDPKLLYVNINFDFNKNENDETISEKQELAFKYFYHLNKSSKIVNDAKGVSALNFSFLNKNIANQIQSAITFDFVRILISIVENSYQRLIECFKLENLSEEEIINRTSSLVTTFMCVEILNKCTFCSRNFCIKFYEEKGLKSLFNLMNNRKIQQSLIKFKNDSSQNQEFVLMKGIIKSVLSTLFNIAKYYHSYINEWKKCNSLKNLLFYLNLMSNAIESKINTTLTVSYIAEDHEIEKNPALKAVLCDILKLIGSSSRKIESKLKLKRKQFKVDECSETIELCYLSHSDTEWSLNELLSALCNFISCDSNKYDIYFKFGANKHLRSIIFHGNDAEVNLGLESIWHLILNKHIANDIKNDKEFYRCIVDLSKTFKTNKHVSFCASGILWSIENYFSKYVYSDDFTKNKHIMICYEKENIDICIKIKSKLEESKYIVWMHAKEVFDCGMESMAIALQDSIGVLVCLSEKFKLNVTCRIQTEYAFMLNKPIIPLLMQKDWKPNDEWYNFK